MRVKCANCGMIYDRVPICDMFPSMGYLPCPRCGSNAADVIHPQPYRWSASTDYTEPLPGYKEEGEGWRLKNLRKGLENVW